MLRLGSDAATARGGLAVPQTPLLQQLNHHSKVRAVSLVGTPERLS
jgi:hypothetical protein